MSETETEAAPPLEIANPPQAPAYDDAESQEYIARAARMSRLHNLMIILVLACGLVCLALDRGIAMKTTSPYLPDTVLEYRLGHAGCHIDNAPTSGIDHVGDNLL